jgi:hypothetical protein
VADRGIGGGGRGGAAAREAGTTLSELSRYLFLAGAVPFVVLGVVHALFTPLSPDRPRPLSPADPQLTERMSRTPLRLTRRADMWKCWVGFNLSHSVGLLVLGIMVVLVGRNETVFRHEGPIFAPVALVGATLYVVLGLRYWFRTPIAGSAIGAALFLASWLLLLD